LVLPKSGAAGGRSTRRTGKPTAAVSVSEAPSMLKEEVTQADILGGNGGQGPAEMPGAG
jgi:hypothetical protein